MIYFLAGLALALCAACTAYTVRGFRRFGFVRKIAARSRVLGWLASLLPVGGAALFGLINVYTAFIALLYLAGIWLLCDLAGRCVRRIAGRSSRRYWAGAAAIALTAACLAGGWYNAHHVRVTEYAFTTQKNLGRDRLRVALVADSHLGITLDGAGFAEQMARAASLSPDAVVIAGDFVDDDSRREDMLAACAALGRLDAPDGVFFIFGNHDEGYFRYRDFTSRELRDALAENGVTILEDRAEPVDGSYYVVGRKDRTAPGRADARALTADLDREKYIILLDHQPNDYENEAAAGADLVLSGHTHGGHIFPAGLIGLATGANDRVYGVETRGNTTFVVTSGISGWAIPFKIGCFSEIVIIDIVPEGAPDASGGR